MAQLIHELIGDMAWRTPAALALRCGEAGYDYATLADAVGQAAQALLGLGLERHARVAVFLEKREEAVLAMFGASAAGCVFVPIDPQLKPAQIVHILRDSGARVLVSSPSRLAVLDLVLDQCPALRHVLHTGTELLSMPRVAVQRWCDCLDNGTRPAHRCIESDVAGLLYVGHAGGLPKGVVVSHRNLVAGAQSLARCLGNSHQDRILALLPLCSADGLAQLTSAFASGAAAVLMNPLLVRDIPEMVARERITGLAAVPALWAQLAAIEWHGCQRLRYLTNGGGALAPTTVAELRARLPHSAVYLMHGQAEGFCSTYLAPHQLARRADSIGKALPNAEVAVVAPDGRPCAANEPGELVQRGPLVALGYWNDPAATSERFRPLRPVAGVAVAETALWSGDTVRMDEDGYIYYLGRHDDLILTAGYRVGPSEIEEVVCATGLVVEAGAVGVPHPVMGQSIVVVARARTGVDVDPAVLLAACRAKLPASLLPTRIELRGQALPRTPAGAIDRRALRSELTSQACALP